jgi:hypothetical protein
MKKLSILFIALLAALPSWAQNEPSAGSTRTKVDFNKYSTFAWAESDPTAVGQAGYEIYYYEFSPERPDPRTKMGQSDSTKMNQSDAMSTPYFYSYRASIPARDKTTNETIKESIANELEGRGYRESESSPDLLVVYQVFDQKAVLHGYTENGQLTTANSTGQEEAQDVTLEPGTLMISFIDNKTSEMVWNGYSSGLVKDRGFTADEADLKQAVHTIFEKFIYTADKAKR